MLTEIEQKVLAYLETVDHGAWETARMIADHAEVFRGMNNASKAGQMTAILKRLRAGGYVEWDRSEPPIIWRRKR